MLPVASRAMAKRAVEPRRISSAAVELGLESVFVQAGKPAPGLARLLPVVVVVVPPLLENLSSSPTYSPHSDQPFPGLSQASVMMVVEAATISTWAWHVAVTCDAEDWAADVLAVRLAPFRGKGALGCGHEGKK